MAMTQRQNKQPPSVTEDLYQRMVRRLIALSERSDLPDPTDEATSLSDARTQFFIALHHCIEVDLAFLRVCRRLFEDPLLLKKIQPETGFGLEELEMLSQWGERLIFLNTPMERATIAAVSRYLRYWLSPSSYDEKDRQRDLETMKQLDPSHKEMKQRIRRQAEIIDRLKVQLLQWTTETHGRGMQRNV
jgi:hypothetical protein